MESCSHFCWISHYDEIIQKWKAALTFVGYLKGRVLYEAFDGRERDFIGQVVSEVWEELADDYELVVPDNIEVVAPWERELMNLLNVDIHDVGIYGKPRSDKTILTKRIYNNISRGYERCNFLANISEKSRLQRLESLQKQLLVDRLKCSGLNTLISVDEGIKLIRCRLSSRKILVLLDDVSETKHLDALAKERKWFGPGSRIIVTTRKREIVDNDEVYGSFEVSYPQKRLQEYLIGSEFQRITNDIILSLTNDEQTFVGLWGVGGVGTTVLAENILLGFDER